MDNKSTTAAKPKPKPSVQSSFGPSHLSSRGEAAYFLHRERRFPLCLIMRRISLRCSSRTDSIWISLFNHPTSCIAYIGQPRTRFDG